RTGDGVPAARHGDVWGPVPPPARPRHLRRAEPVRVPLPVARTRRRRHRRDGRGRGGVLRVSVAETIVSEARRESPLWDAALLADPSWEAIFSPLAPEHFAVGLETIYEAY